MFDGPMLSVYLSLYQALILTSRANYEFMVEPHDITTFSGKNVLIPCRIGLSQNTYKLHANASQASALLLYELIIPHVQWVKDGFALGTYLDLLEYSTKMTMRGDMKKGDFHLEIISVSEEDSGTYQCQITPFHNFIGAVSQEANLTVLVLPGKPEILNGPLIETHEKELVNITCRTKESYPRNIISIHSSNLRFPYHVLNTSDWEQSLSMSKWVFKSITLSTDRNLNGSSIICESKYDLSAFDLKDGYHQANLPHTALDVKAQSVLNVKFIPYVKVEPTGRHMRAKSIGGNQKEDIIIEGSKLRLTCMVTANPKAHEIEWNLNGEKLNNYTDSSLMFNPVLRHNHGDIVKCTARNALGQQTSSYEIKVVYGPQFLVRPKSTIAVNMGDYANFTCLADANPLPNYKWIKIHSPNKFGEKYFENEASNNVGNEREEKNHYLKFDPMQSDMRNGLERHSDSLSSAPYLMFDRVMVNDLGLYRCLVKQDSSLLKKHNHHHSSQITSIIFADAELLLKAPPVIYKIGLGDFNHKINGLISLVMKCAIRSAPRIEEITWTLNGNTLKQQTYPFNIKNTEDLENFWTTSKLEMEINPNFLEPSLTFNCTAINSKGQDSKPWVLYAKDIIKISKEDNTISRRRDHDSAKIITKNELKGGQEFEEYHSNNDDNLTDSWIQHLSLPWMLIGFGLIVSLFLVIGATFFVCDYRRRHNRKGNVSTASYSPTLSREGKKDLKIVHDKDSVKGNVETSQNNSYYDDNSKSKEQSDKLKNQVFENNLVEQVSSDSALSCDGSEEISSDSSMLKVTVPQMPTKEIIVTQINRVPRIIASSPTYYNASSIRPSTVAVGSTSHTTPQSMVQSFMQPQFYSLQKPFQDGKGNKYMTFSHDNSNLRTSKISEDDMEIFYNSHHGGCYNYKSHGNPFISTNDQNETHPSSLNQGKEYTYPNVYAYSSNTSPIYYDR